MVEFYKCIKFVNIIPHLTVINSNFNSENSSHVYVASIYQYNLQTELIKPIQIVHSAPFK